MTKRQRAKPGRRLFGEMMAGVDAMRAHREGRLTLRTHHVEPITLPELPPHVVRQTREALHMSRQVFAFKLGVNPRTLERWEQGRSKPNEQAAALLWLVRRYPDTLERLQEIWKAHVGGVSDWAQSGGVCVVREAQTLLPDRPADEAGLLRRITVNPRILGGKPVIRDRRLAVEHVLAMLAAGDTPEAVLRAYGWLEREDLQACLVYARRIVAKERIEPLLIERG